VVSGGGYFSPGSGDGRSGLVVGVGIRGIALARCVSGVTSSPSEEEEGRVVVGVRGERERERERREVCASGDWVVA
jgi:hypothetical protein